MSFFFTIKVGGSSGEKNIYHTGDELIYIMQGQLAVTIADETHELHTGDSLSFKSHLPHRWYNSGNSETKVIWTLSPFTTI
jgi:quercetin dioxygenase-like cupin family protein